MGGCLSHPPPVPWSHRKVPDKFAEVSEEHGGGRTALMVNIATSAASHNTKEEKRERVLTEEGSHHSGKDLIDANFKKTTHLVPPSTAVASTTTILGRMTQDLLQRTWFFHPVFFGDPALILSYLTSSDLARLTQVDVKLHRFVEAYISIQFAKLESGIQRTFVGSGTQALRFNAFLKRPFTSTCQVEYMDELTVTQFKQKYEAKSIPVVIRDVAASWPAYNAKLWTLGSLVSRFGQEYFRFNDLHGEEVLLKDYVTYTRTTTDDAPLGLYDSQLGVEEEDARRELLLEYVNPVHVFGEDLFALVDAPQRPPFRWLLLGMTKSGTPMHVDPLDTSAWVTVLSGRKLWALFPESVKDLEGQGLAAWDWFYRYFPDCLTKHQGSVAVIQSSGETVFVPGGWNHVVINLEETVAITHNYAPRENLERIRTEVARVEPEFSALWEEKLNVYLSRA